MMGVKVRGRKLLCPRNHRFSRSKPTSIILSFGNQCMCCRQPADVACTALLAACLAVALGGCDAGWFGKKPDMVFRCETVVQDTPTGRVVKYKPIEVIKGNVGAGMLDRNGFLIYTDTLKDDEDVGEIYIFKLWNPDTNNFGQSEKHPFGLLCEMSVELEIDGKGITE
jgi:hypothetical protein